jgi:hypothetical protein
VDALAQAGFGTEQLGIDVSNPAVAQTNLASALAEAKTDGIHLDTNITGSQAFASPALTTATSMQELVPAEAAVTGGSTYDAAPPYPSGLVGSPSLVAVTAAQVVGQSGQTTLLDPSTAVDLTADVGSDGVLHWTVPAGNWALFGFWQRATGQVATQNPFVSPSGWNSLVPTAGPGDYFLADIFSSAGVNQAMSYASSELFGSANLSAMKAEHSTLFHDSLEVQAEMFWTGDFPEQFQERRGYSVIKFLPALWNVAESSFDPLDPADTGPIPPPAFDFTGGVGARVRYDYDETLTDLYADRYLGSFTKDAESLGLQTRVQVAYNYLGLNVTRAAEAVDVPETEGFDFGWPTAFVNTVPQYGTPRWRYRLDAFRETAAGAHIAHHNRVTLEWGDDFAIYQKQPLQYADEFNQAVAAGITQPFLASFAGVASNPWPTPSGLAAIGFGDSWSTNWPQWRDWQPLTTYIARTTTVVQEGSPRLDVAIYNDQGLSSVHDSTPVWADPALGDAGYTYEFVDPVSLTLPAAGAVQGQLFGSGPDYHALIINNQPTMPVATAQAILRMANAGLRVVVVGQPPAASPGLLDAAQDDTEVQRDMTALLRLRNVALVSSEADAPAALARLGVVAAAQFPGAGPLMTVRRNANGREVYWVYNPTPQAITTTGSFAAYGQPTQLNLWTGSQTPVADYTAERDGRTDVPVTLAPYATTAFAFSGPQQVHVVATNAQEASYGPDGNILLADSHGGTYTATLSNGQHATVNLGQVPAPLDVTNWSLNVNELTPTGTTSQNLTLNGLSDWRTIPGLQTAAGQAMYTAQVNVPASWLQANRDGLIDVGDVEGAMQLRVNGSLVTPQTTSDVEMPVTNLLHAGTNTITVRLDTTLLNEMVALDQSGNLAYSTGPTPLTSAPSGLLGPVTLTPQAVASVSLARRW